MNKRSIREQIFKILFGAEFYTREQMPEQAVLYLDSGDLTVTDYDRDYIIGKCSGIMEKLPEIDEKLSGQLKGWSLSRVGKVELAILRLAAYEIMYDEEIPTGVAINEAVELAKKNGQDDAGPFVNGVLGGLSRNLEKE